MTKTKIIIVSHNIIQYLVSHNNNINSILDAINIIYTTQTVSLSPWSCFSFYLVCLTIKLI